MDKKLSVKKEAIKPMKKDPKQNTLTTPPQIRKTPATKPIVKEEEFEYDSEADAEMQPMDGDEYDDEDVNESAEDEMSDDDLDD